MPILIDTCGWIEWLTDAAPSRSSRPRRFYLRQHRDGPTPVALVKSAYRKRQHVVLSDLDTFLDYEIGMPTTVLVSSSNTFVFEGYIVTQRGYTNKYTATGEVLPGQRPGYSLVLPASAPVMAGVGRLAGEIPADTTARYIFVGNEICDVRTGFGEYQGTR